MFMRHRIWNVAMMAAVCFPLLSEDRFDSPVMADEAARFLNDMPENIQSRQEYAVIQAIAGDTSLLEMVRSSRDIPFDTVAGVTVSGIDGKYRLFSPAGNSDRLPLLVYLHGGGWCFGSSNSCARFCMSLVSEMPVRVLAVDYPLSPEHSFPAPLEACIDALGFVARDADKYGFDIDAVSLGGDSAGGNLALSAALFMKSRSDNGDDFTAVMPYGAIPFVHIRSLVLFYPVTKVWNDQSASWREYCEGYGLDGGIMEAFNEAYLGAQDATHPLVSPYCASLSQLAQLPPVMMINAGHDILRDQGRDMCAKMSQAGVEVSHIEFPSATHLFITVAGQPSAFSEAVKATASFLRGEK